MKTYLVALLGAVMMLGGAQLGCTAGAVQAINTATGEKKSFDDKAHVPDDMELCDDQCGCPELIECAHLDATTCAARTDCAVVTVGTTTGCGMDVCPATTLCMKARAACAVADCGAAPTVQATVCSNGKVSGPTGRCVQDSTGTCVWEMAQCHDGCGMDNDYNHHDADNSVDDDDSSDESCEEHKDADAGMPTSTSSMTTSTTTTSTMTSMHR